MGVIVAFNYTAWKAAYPEFDATVTQPQAERLFLEATAYHANDGTGPVSSIQMQTLYLDALTAHLAQLQYGSVNQSSSGLVGRIDSATEGTVSVTAQNDYPPGSAQWYQQTKYGSNYYAMTAKYRTMRYRVSPSRMFNPPRRG